MGRFYTKKQESDLVVKHKGLVISLAYKIAKTNKNHHDIEDYIQVGYVGLLKAIRNYKGINSLSTMAWKYIRWEILNYISGSKKFKRNEMNNINPDKFTYDNRKKKVNFFEYLPILSYDEYNFIYLRLFGYTFMEMGNIIGYSRYTARDRYISIIRKIQSANNE